MKAVAGNRTPSRAAVGLTVKSGWSCAVLIAAGGPIRVLDSTRIELSDPAIPESKQPYHDGFGTARQDGPERSRLIASVERFGRRAVTALLTRYHAGSHELTGVGIVVGSLLDPGQLGNGHMRIHGLEGQLFRRVVEAAVVDEGLMPMLCRERDLDGLAEKILRQPAQATRDEVTAIGKTIAGPWRAEQKTAAIAAWLVLAAGTAGHHPAARPD